TLPLRAAIRWHQHRSAFVLHEEHDEFRRFGLACIPPNDMNVIRAFGRGGTRPAPTHTLCETLVGAKSIAVTFAKGEYGYVLDAGSNLLPLARHGNEGRAGTHRLRLFAERRQERETRRHRRY